jgi:hypothetical protein
MPDTPFLETMALQDWRLAGRAVIDSQRRCGQIAGRVSCGFPNFSPVFGLVRNYTKEGVFAPFTSLGPQLFARPEQRLRIETSVSHDSLDGAALRGRP